jgi:hypothetical protein
VLRGFLSPVKLVCGGSCHSFFLVLRALGLGTKSDKRRGARVRVSKDTVFLALRQPCRDPSWIRRTVHFATQLTVSGVGMQGPACFDARLGIHALTHM